MNPAPPPPRPEPVTPLTDKAEYEVRLGKHRRKVVRPELCRELERELARLRPLEGEVERLKRSVRDLVLTLIEARDGLEYVGKQDQYINYERARIIKDHVAESIEEHGCPTCKGHGFIPAWQPTYSDPDNNAGAPDTAECPDCTP